MSWVKIEINNTKHIEEIEPREEPKIVLSCEPREHLHDTKCELMAEVPRDIAEDILQLWEEIEDDDTLEIAGKLIAIVLEVDDNPLTRVEYDNYFMRIEINPD